MRTDTAAPPESSRADEPRVGFLWALTSVLIPSVVFYIIPDLTGRLGVWGTSAVWFPLAVGFYFLLALLLGKLDCLVIPRGQRLKVVLLGLIQTIGTACFFFALTNAEPGLVSFVNNLTPVLATLGGILLLKERFRPAQALGALLVVAGAMMLTYYDESGSLTGILFMAVGSVFYAAHGLLARRLTEHVDPLALGFWRTGLMALVFVALAAVQGELIWPTAGGDWLLLALGGLLGPVGSIFPYYLALERWGVGKVTLVRGTMPLWVLVWGLVLTGGLPAPLQLVGGGLTLVGTVLIVVFRRRDREKPPASDPSSPEGLIENG